MLSVITASRWDEEDPAFASRTLFQWNYCVTRREHLAIVEFVKQHGHYLPPPSFQSLKPSIQKDKWHVGLNLLSTFDLEVQHRLRMLTHFSVDPVMTVVTCVSTRNFRKKCLLFMWLCKLQCL